VVERLRGEVGELPGARIRRLAETLSFYDADVLVTGGLDRLWSGTVAAGADPKEAANVIANQFVATGIAAERVDAGELAKLIAARAEIPRSAFDEALSQAGDDGFRAAPHLERKVVSDAGAIDPVIDRVIAAHPAQAEQFRGGKEGLLGFFVGQVMKETGGSADPRVVNERVRAKLTV
jgi:aspartyl-tRNA(Asn)/glutamyl-tRNA(Gln) amidotransferase subunit B